MKIFLLIVVLLPSIACSTEANRVVTIDRVLSVTADRPNAPSSQNLTRVYVNYAEWPGTPCRHDAADLLKEDEHTYSLILMAWVSGKSLKIGVDDSRQPNDSVCQIVWVQAT